MSPCIQTFEAVCGLITSILNISQSCLKCKAAEIIISATSLFFGAVDVVTDYITWFYWTTKNPKPKYEYFYIRIFEFVTVTGTVIFTVEVVLFIFKWRFLSSRDNKVNSANMKKSPLMYFPYGTKGNHILFVG